jgi:hypothetical protein
MMCSNARLRSQLMTVVMATGRTSFRCLRMEHSRAQVDDFVFNSAAHVQCRVQCQDGVAGTLTMFQICTPSND